MNDRKAPLLTEVNGPPVSGAAIPTGPLFAFLFPVMAVGLATVALAGAAALLGWRRDEMLLLAEATGAVVALPGLYLLYRQRSDRVAAQRALQNVEARVGGIVESAMDAIISIDSSQRIVQFNAAAERAFLWPRDAVIGQPIGKLIPERFRAAHQAHVERFGHTATTSRGMGNQTVLHGLRANGEEFPIEASISQHEEDGHKLYTVILRDITRRLRNEEMLARSEARLRGILDSAMDAIITVDERQHVVLFNAAAEEVFRCTRAEAVGAPLEWFIPPRFRAGHGDLVRRFGEAGSASRRMGHARVVMGQRRDGEEFPIEASISQVVEEGQRYYTVILRDVTERTRAEEALRRSRGEIEELALAASTAREQEKSRIARELHDELGQALTALKLDVAWLREHTGPGAEATLEKLRAMQLLLDGTVASARRISADLRPLMLDDLGLTAAAEWLVDSFTNRTGIACELVVGQGDLDLPDPHATAVFRVLQECLTNVAKHAEALQVEATLERTGEEIVLTVSDDGRGFDPAEPRGPGSYGLVGLKERALLLGGDVRIDSAPGKGTRIEVTLPTSRIKAAA
jgi:PAS domain S-box-containing protein